ncbi:acyltransferase [Flavobacterium sp. 1355]|uniref:acyltransferase n=1 Tax=Flavobacterium sp. 1355 TaxID=2806571 RepID=UPI001AEA86B8|nr:acyltransferase [Flavobacterium sp. 1355]MBP1224034.1 acetyltransferase-like isoleucine patch superfamily enzyme [Flavobacterium sp. 1355]
MKKIIKSIIKGIVKFLHVFFSPKTSIILIHKLDLLYSIWISFEFKKVSNCFIAHPIYLKGGKYIEIGENCGFDQRLRLEAFDSFLGDSFSPLIKVGKNVSIQKDCHIGAINKIIIGDNVLLASKVYISDHSHGEITKESLLLPPAQRKLYSKGPVIIEDNVWLGEGVIVLPGVTIGENSIVGANAVVTKSIPKNCIVGGNPAKIIREL